MPVRHPKSVPDWSVVQAQLVETIRSICNQDQSNWSCHVVVNEGAELPTLPANVIIHQVNLPLPKMPDRQHDTEAFYDAVRHDKGLRILQAIETVRDDDFSMVVDFDDFVSRRLASLVSAEPKSNGWYAKTGYVYSGGGLIFKHMALDTLCGSTLIIRRGLLGGFRTPTGAVDVAKVKRHLGSHIFIKSDLIAEGTPLAPTPFPATVYRVGNPQSTSGAGQLIGEMTPRWLARKAPLRFAASLLRYRPITSTIRNEFTLPLAPQ